VPAASLGEGDLRRLRAIGFVAKESADADDLPGRGVESGGPHLVAHPEVIFCVARRLARREVGRLLELVELVNGRRCPEQAT
jgi:hypothetical protein